MVSDAYIVIFIVIILSIVGYKDKIDRRIRNKHEKIKLEALKKVVGIDKFVSVFHCHICPFDIYDVWWFDSKNKLHYKAVAFNPLSEESFEVLESDLLKKYGGLIEYDKK